MFTCIKPCYACISDNLFKPEFVGSIYNDPDPTLKRRKLFKRFIKGQSVSWVDPCSRIYFEADSDGDKISQKESDILRSFLIKIGAKEVEVKNLTLLELAENYELYLRAQKKKVEIKAKRSRILDIPGVKTGSLPEMKPDSSTVSERDLLVKELEALGIPTPHHRTGIETLKAMLEDAKKVKES